MTCGPYNPLDKRNLGRSVAEALLLQSARTLSDVGVLAGAGVYALYYDGDFLPYAPISAMNRDGAFNQPIYVGKAVPKGARKGGLSFDASKGRPMRDRLRTHAKSIKEAINIEVADFHYRALMVDDVWIPLGENMLIEQFRPVWNLVIDGFGNKTPGARRVTQHRSQWDALHPGRSFAAMLAEGGSTAEGARERIAAFLAGEPVELLSPEQAVGADPDGE